MQKSFATLNRVFYKKVLSDSNKFLGSMQMEFLSHFSHDSIMIVLVTVSFYLQKKISNKINLLNIVNYMLFYFIRMREANLVLGYKN